MMTVLDRWGNSLGVRLPKGVAEAAGLRAGDRVSIEVVDGGVVIRHARPTYHLEELLARLKPAMLHGEVETSAPTGAEDVW
jgi:antitoxin MazE